MAPSNPVATATRDNGRAYSPAGCSRQTRPLLWLEGDERGLRNLLDLEVEAAKTSGVDWASTLATAHANFVRETSEVFFQSLSGQLKS